MPGHKAEMRVGPKELGKRGQERCKSEQSHQVRQMGMGLRLSGQHFTSMCSVGNSEASVLKKPVVFDIVHDEE